MKYAPKKVFIKENENYIGITNEEHERRKTTDSIVLIEQIKTVDKNRLTEYVGRLDKETMGKVDKAIVISFGIKYLEELLR